MDLSTRIPSIYKDKEMELRSLLLQSLERGKVEFNIFIEYIGKDTPTQINLAAVENYYRTGRIRMGGGFRNGKGRYQAPV